MIIGITGGIGSGKSTIARALAARGYAVYDCDKEAKRIIAENKDVQQQIINLFGEKSFEEVPSTKGQRTKAYNTAYVAQCVFAEPQLLKKLNEIVHPAVREDICQRSGLYSVSAAVCQAKPVLFIESAILYEAGLDSLCDKIIVVEAPEDIRIARTIARDYHGDASPENIDKVRARIHAQRPYLSSIHLSSIGRQAVIIPNDGRKSIDELAEEIIALLN
jgi:dephospho-CoA kinase